MKGKDRDRAPFPLVHSQVRGLEDFTAERPAETARISPANDPHKRMIDPQALRHIETNPPRTAGRWPHRIDESDSRVSADELSNLAKNAIKGQLENVAIIRHPSPQPTLWTSRCTLKRHQRTHSTHSAGREPDQQRTEGAVALGRVAQTVQHAPRPAM